MQKILIDCDTGVDDSIALLLALYHKDIEIVGISTGAGNVSAAQAAENTLRILKLAGKEGEIPVCVGAEVAMDGTMEEFPAFIHGKTGLGNAVLPPSAQQPVAEDVRDFLYRMACGQEEVLLVTLGRFTNVANTLIKYPDFAGKIRRVVSMGGTVNAPGNVSPVAEANVAGDPEAADLVMQAPWQVMMVGLDVTLKTILHMEDVKKAAVACREECRPALAYMERALTYYMDGARRQNWMRDCCPLHDPLAMLTVMEPSLVRTQKRITRVETKGIYTRGMVVTDIREHPIEGRYVEHCVEVDAQRALNYLFAVFGQS